MSNLDGKIILITGAAKVWVRLRQNGCRERATVILSDIIEDQLKATADSLDSAFSRGCDLKR